MKIHKAALPLLFLPGMCLALEGCARRESSPPQESEATSEGLAEASGPVPEGTPSEAADANPAANRPERAPTESSSNRNPSETAGTTPTEAAPPEREGHAGISGGASAPPRGPITSEAAGGSGTDARLAPPRFATSDKALKFATQKRRDAQRSAKKGEKSEAYAATLEAWQALQPHLTDSSCDQMSAYLLAELEGYGEQLSSHGVIIRGKPLKIK